MTQKIYPDLIAYLPDALYNSKIPFLTCTVWQISKNGFLHAIVVQDYFKLFLQVGFNIIRCFINQFHDIDSLWANPFENHGEARYRQGV